MDKKRLELYANAIAQIPNVNLKRHESKWLARILTKDMVPKEVGDFINMAKNNKLVFKDFKIVIHPDGKCESIQSGVAIMGTLNHDHNNLVSAVKYVYQCTWDLQTLQPFENKEDAEKTYDLMCYSGQYSDVWFYERKGKYFVRLVAPLKGVDHEMISHFHRDLLADIFAIRKK